MKKENRVRKSQEFQRIIQEKHYSASSSFVVYFSPKKEDHTRIGISVSKKLGNAVYRNKYKRQLRMMLMELVPIEDCKYDLIVILRKPYTLSDFETNKNNLEKTLKKGRII